MENSGYRLIFDLGRKFDPNVPVFDSRILARGAKDLVRLGLAPKIGGIYADALPASDAADRNTLAFVSHSHLDHTGLLPYISPELPILVSVDTHRLLQALDEAAMGPGKPLNYQPTPFDSSVSHGPFELTIVEVDHDTPGSSALLIEGPDVRLVYTGDLRLHGTHPEKTRLFAQRAWKFKPDVLFIEGTRAKAANNDDILAETELEDAYVEAVTGGPDSVYFNYYPHAIERLISLKAAARRCGRRLVSRAPSLFVAAQMGVDIAGIAVAGGDESQWPAPCAQWVRHNEVPVVDLSSLKCRPKDFMLELPYDRLVELVDLEPASGSIYIHSNGDPLGPFDPNWTNLQFWLHSFDVSFLSIGTPGHASRGDILSIVNTISPRVLMPIHSFNPELIGLPIIPRLMPAYDYAYSTMDFLRAKPPTPDELAEPAE